MTDTSIDERSTTSDKVAVVLPRKKRGQPKVRGMRVSLSKEDIQKLFHLRQVEAAKLLGLSLTALKSVCRKVGVLRWPYSRDRQQSTTSGLGSSASSGWAGEKLEEVSDASTEDASGGGEEEGRHEEWKGSSTRRAEGRESWEASANSMLVGDLEDTWEELEECRRALDAKWIAWYISATDESSVTRWDGFS
ncbi:hypothetical protein GUITHDRAFT_100911 [Guillardia theta CCMP2712]|uniref:RWP-RK domain-containing protein n=1 Tax=Guillardia theta (strain CCMP2712) TaxID=905079 RepID=L1JX92_GUITC|nr:hypothetical protein GUITHDRAFT_100911 [Guillardia theta CCMP2712]EKX53201.1 hypothetical protein GUITHDRAFT_100911 [Guillardia theta CCMP2712]|eukprot:XP_005840181.1 hypothetical protein GUITHDRAFT_100911 [Guillardia theta CCMP2712]